MYNKILNQTLIVILIQRIKVN